jgi:hypothetical protein
MCSPGVHCAVLLSFLTFVPTINENGSSFPVFRDKLVK